jgi:hypothetical protein
MTLILNTHPIIPEMLNVTGQSIKYCNSCISDSLLKSRKICSGDVKLIFFFLIGCADGNALLILSN